MERLPTDGSDARPGTHTLIGHDVRQRQRAVAWLAGQAEVLVEPHLHGEGRGTSHPDALVADEDRRSPRFADDQHRLLEPGIEAGQVGEVGAVLPVGVDHQMVVSAFGGPHAETLETVRV